MQGIEPNNITKRLKVSDAQLWMGNVVLGPATALYADAHELKSLSERHGVIHRTLPGRLDLVFAIGTTVVTGEIKRPHDLLTSLRSKRLARQLRTGSRLGDLTLVVLQGWGAAWYDSTERPEVEAELVKIQALGFYVVPTGPEDHQALACLSLVRDILDSRQRTALSAISGSDRPSSIKGTLLSAVPHLGKKLVRRLLEKYGDARHVFALDDETLRREGIPINARRAMQRGLDSGLDGN